MKKKNNNLTERLLDEVASLRKKLDDITSGKETVLPLCKVCVRHKDKYELERQALNDCLDANDAGGSSYIDDFRAGEYSFQERMRRESKGCTCGRRY